MSELVVALGQRMTPERAAIELAEVEAVVAAGAEIGAEVVVPHSGYAKVVLASGERFELLRGPVFDALDAWSVRVAAGPTRERGDVLGVGPTPLAVLDRIAALEA